MTVPAVPDRITAHAQMLSAADAKAAEVEASFRRRTLDEVYEPPERPYYGRVELTRVERTRCGLPPYSAENVPSHSISPARLAGV